MSIIIIGAGEVGYNVASRLSRERKDIVVIDKDEQKVHKVADTLDVHSILGSGSSMSVLRKAGIEAAEIVIAATDSDEVNMVSCLVAGVQAFVPTKIARIRDPEYANNTKILGPDRLGIDLVINTDQEVVNSVLRVLETHRATDVVDLVEGKLRMACFVADKGNPFTGQQLIGLKKIYPDMGLVVAAIYRGNRVIIPRGNDTIADRDLVYVMGAPERVSRLLSSFPNSHPGPMKRVMIFGGGNVGLNLAKALEKRAVSTKIIDPREERCQFLAAQLEKATVLKGDFTSHEMLKEEGLGEMDAVVASTPDDENNILLCLLAKRMGARRTVACINRIAYSPLAYHTGVDVVVSPSLIAVNRILQYVRRGKIAQVVTLPEDQAEVIELEALETSDLVNKELRKLGLPKGMLVGAITRGDQLLIPDGDTVIQPGDKVAMVVASQALKDLERVTSVKLEFW